MLRFLIVEDEFASPHLLKNILVPYGDCDVAVNGNEAIQSFELSIEEKQHYHLICLGIMMPHSDGIAVLKKIRAIEKATGILPQDNVKIIMISALDIPKIITDAFYYGAAAAYHVRPINKNKLLKEIQRFGLIEMR